MCGCAGVVIVVCGSVCVHRHVGVCTQQIRRWCYGKEKGLLVRAPVAEGPPVIVGLNWVTRHVEER